MQPRWRTWIWRGALATVCVSAVLHAHRAPNPARAAQVDSWQLLVPSTAPPPPRGQFGLAADTVGNLYLYGGSGAGGVALADFWVFRAVGGTWLQLPNTVVPALIEPHLAVDAAGNVLEFGGIGDPKQPIRPSTAPRPEGTRYPVPGESSDPHLPHMSPDGYSYGLYRYTPGGSGWVDLTAPGAIPGDNWPRGREDHGFAYDAQDDRFYVYAGEGTEALRLNDLWSYDEAGGNWSLISQRFVSPTGAPRIDPREIYNISYDNHHGFYLFGGAFLIPDRRSGGIPPYVNDLWHFDVPSSTWTLVSGTANAYDPSLPVPRHYYGQACDANGNFYVLGGYVSDTSDPPFFEDDDSLRYAEPVQLPGRSPTTGFFTYGLADFWFFSPGSGRWIDLSGHLGGLAGQARIPYVMTADPANDEFVIFGGYRLQVPSSVLALTNMTWVYGLPAESGVMPAISTSATPTSTVTAAPTPATAATQVPNLQYGAVPRMTAAPPTGTPVPVPVRPAPGNDDNPPP